MNKRTLSIWCSAVAVLMLVVSVAFAVHDNGLFELDSGGGNTLNDGAVPGEDWSDVYAGTSSAFATAFIVDTFANGAIAGYPTPENSFFTGGGSKDTLCLQDPCEPSGYAGGPWKYDTVNDVVPDKNDIGAAFAAAYEDPGDGHTIFYFGLDTYAVQGDSNAGFWFFRQPVGLEPLEPGETEGYFSGDHTAGDIFVAVAYTGGGKVGDIKVYTWDDSLGTGGKPVGLVLVDEGLDCADAAADDDVCGVVNSVAGEDPPWNYLNKDGGTTYQVPAFVEFGLDVNAILGQDIGCFSTFLAETRSSQSETSQLKDFALGAFPVCEIGVTKASEDLSKVGDEIDYSITIENTGHATLYKQSITDSLVGDLTGDAGCGAYLEAGQDCTIEYSYTVMEGDPDPLENTVEILYTEFAEGGLAFADSYTATVNLFQPAISFDKEADGSDGPITITQGEVVDYTLYLSNDSSGDTPNLICDISDVNLGVDVQDLSLGSGSDHTVNKPIAFSFPTASPFPWCILQPDNSWLCTNTANVLCSPDGFPNQLPAEDSVAVTVIPAQVNLVVLKEGDAFGKVGDPVDYTITITNNNVTENVTLTSIMDTLLDDLKNPANYTSSTCAPTYMLAPGASCVIEASRTVLEADPDPLPNEVTVVGTDQYGNASEVTDDHSVDLIHPDYTVSKTCLPAEPVPPGTFVSFQIDTDNTGDAELVLTSMFDTLLGELLPGDVDLNQRGGAACDEAAYLIGPTTGCYRVEESVQIFDDVSNTVTVYAGLNDRYGLPNTYDKSDTATCEVEEFDITRTWGFWKTHGSDGTEFDPPVDFGYTCYVAENYLGFPIDLGWLTLMNCEDVFGLFWENKAQCSQIEKAQIQASRQFLAAMLNYAAFGTPIPDSCISKHYEGMTTTELFQAMREALDSGDRKDIQKLAGIFACYNESGDEQSIVDTVPVPHADPNGTRAVADFGLITCGK